MSETDTKPSAKELQATFWKVLNRVPQLELQSLINSTEKFTQQMRIDVYKDAYYWRLLNILKDDYPVVWELVGDEVFEKLASLYIKHFPSTYFSVRYFGEEFAQCLATTKPFNKKLFLSEMAGFEWSLGQALDLPDAPAFSIQQMLELEQEKWPDYKFSLHPACIPLRVNFNTLQVYKTIKNEQQPIEYTKLDSQQYVLVWRKQQEVKFQSLNNAEAIILQSIIHKKNFAQVLEALLTEIPEDKIPNFAIHTLKIWGDENILKK